MSGVLEFWSGLLPGLPNTLGLLRWSVGGDPSLGSCLRLSVGDGECMVRSHLGIVPPWRRTAFCVLASFASKLSHQSLARLNNKYDLMRSSADNFCANASRR